MRGHGFNDHRDLQLDYKLCINTLTMCLHLQTTYLCCVIERPFLMLNSIFAPITDADRANDFTGEIKCCQNVLALPPDRNLRKDRELVLPEHKARIYHRRKTVSEYWDGDAAQYGPAKTLQGCHMFGGFVRFHFGHYLVECLSTIWGLDHIPEKIDKIVYLAFHDPALAQEAQKQRLQALAESHLRSFGIDPPIEIIYEPTTIEKLYVPENGFGFDKLFNGSTPFRNFFRKRHAQLLPDEKDVQRGKLFVSRTKVGPGKGHLVGETALEKTFANAGYEVFYPEDHSLETQIQRYRTADTIVGVEGSALHLTPFSIQTDAKVAIISRRSTHENIASSYGAQFKGFTGIEPLILGEHIAHFQRPDASRIDYNCVTVTNFDVIYEALQEHGFLSADDTLFYPRPEDLTHRLELNSQRAGVHLTMSHLNFKG